MRGGPAGLMAASKLFKAGVESTVIEQDQTVDRISRTVSFKDYYFDVEGHRFFTKVKAVEDMWKEGLDEVFFLRNRLPRIFDNKKFFIIGFALLMT